MITIKHRHNFKKNSFEVDAWAKNQCIAGIDEVGRGCLAGPVVTAAVVLPPFKTKPFLKDSKLMTSQQREQAYTWIIQNCCYSIGITDHRTIDTHNIWQSTLMAMKKAALQLLATSLHPITFLIDAMPLALPDSIYENSTFFHHFVYGERKSSSIAAASILAKVTRDRLMQLYDAIIPGYGFAEHKGYATLQHRKMLDQNGTSLIHRITFGATRDTMLIDGEKYEQKSIC
jgi:ribonuclease HII